MVTDLFYIFIGANAENNKEWGGVPETAHLFCSFAQMKKRRDRRKHRINTYICMIFHPLDIKLICYE